MAASAMGVLVLIVTPMLLGTIAPLSSAPAAPADPAIAPLRQITPQPRVTPSTASRTKTPTTRPTATRPKTSAPPVAGKVDCRRVKCIALTFDDGPGDYTDQVLAILKASGAHASFFMIGSQISAYPAQVRRVQAAGHDLGNHTWSHPHLAGMSLAAQKRQIALTQAAYSKVGVKPPTLMRPPYGEFDANTARLGMVVAMWSVDTLDWLNKNSAKTIQLALAGAKPGGVILMHEIHPSTVAALPKLIASLQRQGYAVVSMTQMCGKVKPGTVVTSCGG